MRNRRLEEVRSTTCLILWRVFIFSMPNNGNLPAITAEAQSYLPCIECFHQRGIYEPVIGLTKISENGQGTAECAFFAGQRLKSIDFRRFQGVPVVGRGLRGAALTSLLV